MIKRCPSCSRTYSDESISFCLADGALLSAPYEASKEEAPATEVLPSVHVDVPPTQPAKPAVPTMASLPGGHNYSPLAPTEQQQNRKKSRPLLWTAIAFAVIAGIVIALFAARRVFTAKTQAGVTSSPEEFVAQNSPSAPVTPQNPTLTSTPTQSVRPNIVEPQPETKNTASPEPATLQADPMLFPPTNNQTPKTKAESATDYNSVFSTKEVDSKVRILSKPEPQYTEAARKNQVAGVVVLRAVFSSNSSVTNVSVIRGLPDGLSERAIAAARQIKFVPATKDGHPVSMWMQLEYNFNLY